MDSAQPIPHVVICIGDCTINPRSIGEPVEVIIVKILISSAVQVIGDDFDVADIVRGIASIENRPGRKRKELIALVKGFGYGDTIPEDHRIHRAEGFVRNARGQGLVDSARIEDDAVDKSGIDHIGRVFNRMAGGISDTSKVSGIVVIVFGHKRNHVDGSGFHHHVSVWIVTVFQQARRIRHRRHAPQEV